MSDLSCKLRLLARNGERTLEQAADENERLLEERDEARRAARWWRMAARGYQLKSDETHPDEKWPWLEEASDG